MSRTIFITGNSQGLGYGLTRAYLELGNTVYGCSRSGCHGLQGDLHDLQCDLSDMEKIPGILDNYLGKLDQLDVVILNAGILGDIQDLHETPLDNILKTFDINVWSNKVILDWLHSRNFPVKQIILISSGAAVNGNRGWNGYALSKAALNMLTAQYAHEFPETHLSAFAPGIVHTGMQDKLCNDIDTTKYPSIQALKNAMGTDAMPDPVTAARTFVKAFDNLMNYPSGSFLDIRKIS